MTYRVDGALKPKQTNKQTNKNLSRQFRSYPQHGKKILLKRKAPHAAIGLLYATSFDSVDNNNMKTNVRNREHSKYFPVLKLYPTCFSHFRHSQFSSFASPWLQTWFAFFSYRFIGYSLPQVRTFGFSTFGTLVSRINLLCSIESLIICVAFPLFQKKGYVYQQYFCGSYLST